MTREEIHLRLLDNILAVTSSMTVGKRKAEAIVGGRKKLARLYESGKIDCLDKCAAQNGKWRFNLAQVLQHCRPQVQEPEKSNN